MYRFLRRILKIAVLGGCAVLFLILVASQIGQRIYRHRAEHLLSQVQSLELRKTPWTVAQRQLKRWERETQFDERCDRSECSVTITLFESVYSFLFRNLVFVHLDDYLRWRLKLSYSEGPFVRMEESIRRGYELMGGRPAQIDANVGMRDGVVWSKGYMVHIDTYWHNIPGFDPGYWIEYGLIADAHSVPQFDTSGRDWLGYQRPLHPNYRIGRPGGCDICILGFVHFTPYADPGDIRRLMQLDLSCLTRVRPCLDQNDIMPGAWKQYLAERPLR